MRCCFESPLDLGIAFFDGPDLAFAFPIRFVMKYPFA